MLARGFLDFVSASQPSICRQSLITFCRHCSKLWASAHEKSQIKQQIAATTAQLVKDKVPTAADGSPNRPTRQGQLVTGDASGLISCGCWWNASVKAKETSHTPATQLTSSPSNSLAEGPGRTAVSGRSCRTTIRPPKVTRCVQVFGSRLGNAAPNNRALCKASATQRRRRLGLPKYESLLRDAGHTPKRKLVIALNRQLHLLTLHVAGAKASARRPAYRRGSALPVWFIA